MSDDSFGDRMKGYEHETRFFLKPKTPVIIRLDGRAFHTFARNADKPYDRTLSEAMAQTTNYLVNKIQTCVFGYTQSDEISLLLLDDKAEETQPWFGGNLGKILSISAAETSVIFNAELTRLTRTGGGKFAPSSYTAVFDSRAFNLPKNEVRNYFIWRQADCYRNSVNSVAQFHYSQKKLEGKKQPELLKMIEEAGDKHMMYPYSFRYGIHYLRGSYTSGIEGTPFAAASQVQFFNNLLNHEPTPT